MGEGTEIDPTNSGDDQSVVSGRDTASNMAYHTVGAEQEEEIEAEPEESKKKMMLVESTATMETVIFDDDSVSYKKLDNGAVYEDTEINPMMTSNNMAPIKTRNMSTSSANYTRLYKRRWLMLGLFCMLSMSNAFQWIQYSVIGNVIVEFYDVEYIAVDWLSMIYMLVYIPLIFPVTWLLERAGLKVVGILGASLNCAGSWFRYAGAVPHLFPLAFAGQTLCAIGQVFILGMPAHVAATWFGAKEVSTACAVGVFGNQIVSHENNDSSQPSATNRGQPSTSNRGHPSTSNRGHPSTSNTGQPSTSIPMPARPYSPEVLSSDDDFDTKPSVAFPSFYSRGKRRSFTRSSTCGTKKSKRTLAKSITKTIICLVRPDVKNGTLPAPKPSTMSSLSQRGLVGAVRLNKSYSCQEVREEITSCFKDVLNVDNFQFKFLKMLPGNKWLAEPKVSRSITYTGEEVLSICGQGKLYIMTEQEVTIPQTEIGELDLPFVDIGTATSATAGRAATATAGRAATATAGRAATATPGHAATATPGRAASATASCSSVTSTLSLETSPTYRNFMGLLPVQEAPKLPDEQPEVQQNGVSQHVPCSVDDLIMLEAMDGWVHANVDKEANKSKVIVRRSHILQDALRAFKSPLLNSMSAPSITFLGEPGIDTGGLTREFATLIMPIMRDSKFFIGEPGKMMPSKSFSSFLNGEMQAVGKICGAILLHSRQRLAFLNPILAELLITEDPNICPWAIELIPDKEQRQRVQKIHDSSTAEELEAALEESSVFEDLGWTKIPTLENAAEIVRAATASYTYFQNKAIIDAFLAGLNFYGTKEFGQSKPDCLRSLFGQNGSKIDANVIFECFSTDYSPVGSNNRNKEEATTMWFIEFLEKCGSGDDSVSGMTLQEFVMFFSGATQIPLGGFQPKPSLQFSDEKLPLVSTCTLELKVPRTCASEDDFISMLVDGIRNSQGFGLL